MIDTEEIYSKFSTSTTEEAENVISGDSNKALQYSQTYNVHVPKPEDKVVLNASSVKKIQGECQKAKEIKFPYAELFLGIASLLIGAFLSAIISQVPYELKPLGLIFYTICPVGGAGFGVAYCFCRKNDVDDTKKLATRIEEYIQDVDEVESEE